MSGIPSTFPGSTAWARPPVLPFGFDRRFYRKSLWMPRPPVLPLGLDRRFYRLGSTAGSTVWARPPGSTNEFDRLGSTAGSTALGSTAGSTVWARPPVLPFLGCTAGSTVWARPPVLPLGLDRRFYQRVRPAATCHRRRPAPYLPRRQAVVAAHATGVCTAWMPCAKKLFKALLCCARL